MIRNRCLTRLIRLFVLMLVYPQVCINAQDTIPVPIQYIDTIPLPMQYIDTIPLPMQFMDTFSAEGELELNNGENLDSLLNLWYVNRALEDAVDDYNPEADTLIPDFPDSV